MKTFILRDVEGGTQVAALRVDSQLSLDTVATKAALDHIACESIINTRIIQRPMFEAWETELILAVTTSDHTKPIEYKFEIDKVEVYTND